jgi:hypothetical protein
MKFGLDPIGHVSPRPRIDLGARRFQPGNVEEAGFSFSPAYCEFLWRMTKATAEASNIRSSASEDNG